MKKKKVIAYSVLGIGLLAIGYFLVKKIKEDKTESEESEEGSTSKEFSSKIVSVGNDVRGIIGSLMFNTGNDRNALSKMENLVNKLGSLTSKEQKDMTEWYNSQDFKDKYGKPSLVDFQGALERTLSPLWYDRAKLTLGLRKSSTSSNLSFV